MKSVQEKINEFVSRVCNSRDSANLRSGGGGGAGKAIKFPMKVRKQQQELHPSPAEEDGTCIAHRYSKPRPKW